MSMIRRLGSPAACSGESERERGEATLGLGAGRQLRRRRQAAVAPHLGCRQTGDGLHAACCFLLGRMACRGEEDALQAIWVPMPAAQLPAAPPVVPRRLATHPRMTWMRARWWWIVCRHRRAFLLSCCREAVECLEMRPGSRSSCGGDQRRVQNNPRHGRLSLSWRCGATSARFYAAWQRAG